MRKVRERVSFLSRVSLEWIKQVRQARFMEGLKVFEPRWRVIRCEFSRLECPEEAVCAG